MRVIAGSLKGRRLKAPTWDGLRPTSDKLRETLFNVLTTRVSGARLVDGFAGTGALGIEALSRGAAEVAFIERDPRAVSLIEANLAQCHVERGYAIIRAPFEKGAGALRARPSFAPYDIILLDPPYHQESRAKEAEAAEAGAPMLAAAAALLAADGVLVLEHARKGEAPMCEALARTRQIVSGDSVLSFYAVISGA